MKSLIIWTFVVFQSIGCAAPFSDFQSARLAGKGKIEVTTSYTTVENSGQQIYEHLGSQLAVGVLNKLDLRLRYERVWFESDDLETINVVGFGPKIPLHRDRLALYWPVGCAFGENVETSKSWEAHPTLIVTHVVNPSYEVNFSMKAQLSLTSGSLDPRIAVNLGLGVGPETMKFMLRPEAGVLFHTSGGDPFYQLGLGLSLATTNRKRSDSEGYSKNN